ncbi:hypothetical protein OHB24_12040 [Kribbella sp. NBC_00482]|uniref:hypothetical protein n=1 Tax=Kribbella sp. NBC_00482 TaxID=2975968 RepID=UPI002E184654
MTERPPTISWVRRLLVAAAVLDFVALIAFVVLYATDRSAIADWVSSSPAFAGQVRNDGVDATVRYATVSVCAVHLIITLVFSWLAVAVGRGRQRIRATVVLVVTTCIDGFVATTPVGGVVQQVVMVLAAVVKIAALALLWAPRSSREFFVTASRDRRDLAAPAR